LNSLVDSQKIAFIRHVVLLHCDLPFNVTSCNNSLTRQRIKHLCAPNENSHNCAGKLVSNSYHRIPRRRPPWLVLSLGGDLSTTARQRSLFLGPGHASQDQFSGQVRSTPSFLSGIGLLCRSFIPSIWVYIVRCSQCCAWCH
jgi:hypothetical protein